VAESVEDEVVSSRGSRGPAQRAVVDETVNTSGEVTVRANGVEEETIGEGGRVGRQLSDSTKKLLAKLEAGKNADDPDDEVSETGEEIDPDDVGLVEGTAAPAKAPVQAAAEGEETTEEEVEEKPPVVDEWQEKAMRLDRVNRELLAQVETLGKAPKASSDPRIEALLAADQAYVDEGPVAAVRKFISVVLAAAHDSKDVESELAGLYTDLTARELGVPLDTSHLAMREAARARLALARDKRERKVQSEAASQKPGTAGSDQVDEAAITYIDNQLTTKREGGKSFADEHPMLMAMAEHLDGAKPGKLLAKVIKQEIQVGNLDRNLPDDVLIRKAAQRIEEHYQGLWKKFPTSQPKTDITKSGDQKTAPAKAASNEQRQQTQARTINNASASVAPATSPKTKKAEPKVEERPKFKSDKERREYALRHLPE
jgi:hypothetical protein